ncbi:unnamed protein product [Enterobius vermicularis]|uniref:GST N-terminal domain-containing protein n=1 Tax=Enterobius vermicularis TaxID=51028 RepID=A0A0N4VHL3_ENTVE|nr:unnamed protein product [Enterobius vermicularis]
MERKALLTTVAKPEQAKVRLFPKILPRDRFANLADGSLVILTLKVGANTPKFKLHENRDTRSELVHLLFSVAKVPYESFDYADDNTEALQNSPLKELPLLEIDGVAISGEMAICRQLGWRFGKQFCH